MFFFRHEEKVHKPAPTRKRSRSTSPEEEIAINGAAKKAKTEENGKANGVEKAASKETLPKDAKSEKETKVEKRTDDDSKVLDRRKEEKSERRDVHKEKDKKDSYRKEEERRDRHREERSDRRDRSRSRDRERSSHKDRDKDRTSRQAEARPLRSPELSSQKLPTSSRSSSTYEKERAGEKLHNEGKEIKRMAEKASGQQKQDILLHSGKNKIACCTPLTLFQGLKFMEAAAAFEGINRPQYVNR